MNEKTPTTEMNNPASSNGKQEIVIEIKDLKKSFGNQKVLNGIDLKVYTGENLVVIGKSGSGKSVLIKCIARLISSDSGSISVFNEDVIKMENKKLGELRTKIGFLFQSGALYDSMTVKQNLEFPLRRIKREMTTSEVDEKINEALTNVGLADTLNKMPSQLSGGMRKRISLARTIVVDPMIMLYDEPTTGLDPVTSDEISALILEVQKKYKTTSIIITHDIACAKTTGNRIVMLKDGSMYKEGSIQEFETSTDPEIHSFFK